MIYKDRELISPCDTDSQATHNSVGCVRGHPWHPIILTSCPAFASTDSSKFFLHICTSMHVFAKACCMHREHKALTQLLGKG